MTKVLYDESTFPEYEEKVRRGRRQVIQTVVAGIAVYFLMLSLFAFVLFPSDPPQSKVRGALILLVVPIFTGIFPPIAHSLNTRNPRRVTAEAIEAVGKWPLADIKAVVWHGPDKGVEIHLDPETHWIKRGRIDGKDLLRPEGSSGPWKVEFPSHGRNLRGANDPPWNNRSPERP